MVTRLLALGAALVVTAQALVFCEARTVCKYTGRVVEPCPCPQGSTEQPGHVAREGCCELRKLEHFPTPALLAAAPIAPDRSQLALPAEPWNAPALTLSAPDWQPPRAQGPPPRGRLYVSLRHLLI